MLKLYKRIGDVLHYREGWVTNSAVVEHLGGAGERGKTREHKLSKKADPETAVAEVLKSAASEGYVPVDEIGESMLVIEYAVEGFGSPADLEKRHALEDRLDETLGWTGLGHCDGGSIGLDTMEVYCFVADFGVAKRVVEADLAGTVFADFTRIYEGHTEPGAAANGGE